MTMTGAEASHALDKSIATGAFERLLREPQIGGIRLARARQGAKAHGTMTTLRIAALAALATLLGACANYEAFNGWWAQSVADSITISGEETSFGEGWFLRVDSRGACGVRVGQFRDQVNLRLYSGPTRRGVVNLDRSDVLRGQYMDEYGPRDPLQFRLDGARLRLDWWFPGDTQPRVTYFRRALPPTNPAILAATERCR